MVRAEAHPRAPRHHESPSFVPRVARDAPPRASASLVSDSSPRSPKHTPARLGPCRYSLYPRARQGFAVVDRRQLYPDLSLRQKMKNILCSSRQSALLPTPPSQRVLEEDPVFQRKKRRPDPKIEPPFASLSSASSKRADPSITRAPRGDGTPGCAPPRIQAPLPSSGRTPVRSGRVQHSRFFLPFVGVEAHPRAPRRRFLLPFPRRVESHPRASRRSFHFFLPLRSAALPSSNANNSTPAYA